MSIDGMKKTWTQAQMAAAMTADLLRNGYEVVGEIRFEASGGEDDGLRGTSPKTITASADMKPRAVKPRQKTGA